MPNKEAALELLQRYRNDGSCERELVDLLLDKPTAPADLSSAPVQDQTISKATAIPTREEREELRRILANGDLTFTRTSRDLPRLLEAIDTLEQQVKAEAERADSWQSMIESQTNKREYIAALEQRLAAAEADTLQRRAKDLMGVTLCTRDYQHKGPCNGFPRPACVDAARKEGKP